MDEREFTNLQEALIWVIYPIAQLLLGLLLSGSIIGAVFVMFGRAARYLTRARR
jgi:hypothetical protein